MHFTPCLIYCIFELNTHEYDPLDLKCCYCNVFDQMCLTFKINRAFDILKCIIFVFDSETIPTEESHLINNNNNTWQ